MSSDLSQCGLSCLVSALSSTSCGNLLNTTCLCPDQSYTDLVSTCVLSNCTVGEQLSLKIATSRNCNVAVRDRSGEIGVLQGVVTPIQDILFLLRVASRLLRLAPWSADDTTIVIAWLLQNVLLGGGIVASRIGIGRDVWGLDESRIIEIIKLFIAFEVLYTITLGLIKMSICFFYLRIFPDNTFRRWLWATQVFNALLFTTFVIVDLTQCQPLSWFWNRLDEHTTETGRCININAMPWAHAIINIALDVWMLAMPATQILNLQMAWGRKLRVLAMFALGALLTLISCIRLKSLVAFAKTQNPTQDFFDLAVWSAIELTTGVIVACLPATRQVLVKYGPTLRTMVSEYALRASAADWSTRSNANNTKSLGKDKTPRQRTTQQRSSDEIPMTTLSDPHTDHARPGSEPTTVLSKTDSPDPS